MPTNRPTTDNGRLIEAVYAAFGKGDVPYVLARIAPHVEWIETEAEAIPMHGTFVTPEEVLRNVFAKVPELFETFDLHPELWVEKDDDVVVTGRVQGRARTGKILDAPYAHLFTVRDGKILRNDNFHDTALWLAALSSS